MAAIAASDSHGSQELSLSATETQPSKSSARVSDTCEAHFSFESQASFEHLCVEETIKVPLQEFRSPYKMNASPDKHGDAVIINNIEVDGYYPREGGQRDEDNLKDLFTHLRYDVQLKPNLDASGFATLCQTMKDKNFSKSDSFVCCFLSHGGKVDDMEVFLLSDGTELSINQLKHMAIENKSLRGKPKLFFVQACRGSKLPPTPMPAFDDRSDCYLPKKKIFRPYYADVFVGYATHANTKAIREQVDCAEQNVEAGSWYITQLCHVLKTLYESHDLLSMMTIVHNILARDARYILEIKIKGSNDVQYYRQAGQLESTLTAPLYFGPIPSDDVANAPFQSAVMPSWAKRKPIYQDWKCL